ncbi:MAG: alpha/beta fold hydrolase, partial [Desulfobulbaceae bacterium]|nr:alpha/beta fold hydrolase [Desulfobulbaceae bacterium]
MAVNSFFSFPSSAGQSAVAGHRPPLVLLPGWGFDGRIFELGPLPEPCFLPMSLIEPASLVADLAAFLAREGIPRIRLAGWSMGANLALDFARAHPHRLESLFLLSLRQQWPAEELAAIRRELLADPQPFLASFYRKCFAGDRPGYRRFAEGLEQSYLAAMDLPCLGRGLDYLAQSRPAAVAGVDHCQLLHGRRDIIAPVGEMATLPGARVKIYDQGGHALFLAPGFCWPESGGAIRKQAIRHRFSRAAASYEAHADVQLQVAAMLAARLPAAPVATILEIGCGSGSYTAMLADRFPHAEILALDFSPGMVEAARQRFHGTERLRFLCLDAEEFLAETDQRFDLVTSNATLQWFDHVVAALGRMAACLNPDGALLCSLFGPATLGELGQG